VNILVELTRSNITLDLHNNLGVFSHVSQLKFQNYTRSHAFHILYSKSNALFTYCIQNQMHFSPFAQNHTPILVSHNTMFLWTFQPCFHILYSYCKVEACVQSSKFATTKLKGFVWGGEGGYHLPSTNFLCSSPFKFQKIPTLMGLV
jgi:hypothetical protein